MLASNPMQAAKPAAARGLENSVRIRRFDADRLDETVTLAEALSEKPTERQLMWIDVVGDLESNEWLAIGKRFEFDQKILRALERQREYPALGIYGGYFHLRVVAEPDIHDTTHVSWLDII